VHQSGVAQEVCARVSVSWSETLSLYKIPIFVPRFPQQAALAFLSSLLPTYSYYYFTLPLFLVTTTTTTTTSFSASSLHSLNQQTTLYYY